MHDRSEVLCFFFLERALFELEPKSLEVIIKHFIVELAIRVNNGLQLASHLLKLLHFHLVSDEVNFNYRISGALHD